MFKPFVRSLMRRPLKSSQSATERQAAIIRPLFDVDWYLATNKDVAGAGVDPVWHYLEDGSAEGRFPNPIFDPTWYRDQNSDLNSWPDDVFCHFVQHGRFEGRRPSRSFDPAAYRGLYPDVVAAGMDPAEHYILFGGREGRALVPAAPAPQPVTPVQSAPAGDEPAPTVIVELVENLIAKHLIETGCSFPVPRAAHGSPVSVGQLAKLIRTLATLDAPSP